MRFWHYRGIFYFHIYQFQSQNEEFNFFFFLHILFLWQCILKVDYGHSITSKMKNLDFSASFIFFIVFVPKIIIQEAILKSSVLTSDPILNNNYTAKQITQNNTISVELWLLVSDSSTRYFQWQFKTTVEESLKCHHLQSLNHSIWCTTLFFYAISFVLCCGKCWLFNCCCSMTSNWAILQ